MPEEWKNRWGTWTRPTNVTGVYERREGGFLVRRIVTEKATRKSREIKRVLPSATLGEAITWLDTESAIVREGASSRTSPRPRFATFAASVMQRKVDAGDLRSPASRAKWQYALEHLVGGTKTEDDELLVAGFGDFFVDEIRVKHVEDWRADCGKLVLAGRYDPSTINHNWIPILRAVLKAASREFSIHNPAEELKGLSEDEHPDYTEEQPNALTDEEIGRFLSELREAYPQHYAMALLGFVTGLRPSTLRPLRRTGPDRDVRWDDDAILIRRSQTIGEPINKTKTGLRQRIPLPVEVMDILRWHVETQLTTPEQAASDLLFPSITGSFRSNTVLRKPFEDVLGRLKIGKTVTAKGMRRTFNDLTRLAGVRDVVIRAISGHQTERMQHHYSTPTEKERRGAIANVVDLASRRAPEPVAVPPKDRTEPVPGRKVGG